MLAITDGKVQQVDKTEEKKDDDDIDWDDFVLVQTIDYEMLDITPQSEQQTEHDSKIDEISKKIQSANQIEIINDAPFGKMKVKKDYVKPALSDIEKQ